MRFNCLLLRIPALGHCYRLTCMEVCGSAPPSGLAADVGDYWLGLIALKTMFWRQIWLKVGDGP